MTWKPQLRAWRSIFFLAIALCLSGCGTPVGQVTGKVTYQAKSAGNVQLHWTSVADPDLTFVGISDAEGNHQTSYRTYSGIHVGKYALKITRTTVAGGKGPSSGEESAVLKAAGKAMTESFAFEKEIVAGKNVMNFELTEGKKLPPDGSNVKVVP